MNMFLTVVVRRDLGMTAGLLSAQVFHIGHEFHRKAELEGAALDEEEMAWMKSPYIHVRAVNTPEELHHVYNHARNADLQVHLWRDLITSQVLPKQELECDVGIAIGPCDLDAVRAVAGHLPFYVEGMQ